MHCPLRTPQHSTHCVSRRGPPATCRHSAHVLQAERTQIRSRRRAVCVQAAKTLYDALGVSQEASDRDIKRAYRQKALKLHPDVNKAVSPSNLQQQIHPTRTVLHFCIDLERRPSLFINKPIRLTACVIHLRRSAADMQQDVDKLSVFAEKQFCCNSDQGV
eukprot:GHUV01046547.1.p1 GENE.GHUV01046547.1~~GHUV01046547.1.p1  ORF type:complete len:161 (-),score=2.44 GHUV01046547.1:54-536(-)